MATITAFLVICMIGYPPAAQPTVPVYRCGHLVGGHGISRVTGTGEAACMVAPHTPADSCLYPEYTHAGTSAQEGNNNNNIIIISSSVYNVTLHIYSLMSVHLICCLIAAAAAYTIMKS